MEPFFANKSHGVQLAYLALFFLAGLIFSNGLAMLLTWLFFGSMNVTEASHPLVALQLQTAVTSIGTFLAPALLFAYCQDRQWWHYNQADRKPAYHLVNVTLILSIIILPLVALLGQWNEAIPLPDALQEMENSANDILEKLMQGHSYSTLILNIIVLGLIPAVCEEFLFQGSLQPLLTKWTKRPHAGIWITAFIFSAIHLQFAGFIPRFLLGAYLGYLFYWSRSLWLPILAHFLHNALTIMISFTLSGRGIDLENIKFTQIHGAIPMIITCVIGTLISLVFMYKTKDEGIKS
ncbi:MAG: CPBP family intramembrane metalloprotease [Bacteroidales bacterium]|nr:CPBP family intramembrane metalloprotease [Bacteroidales bacterium]